MRNKRSDSDAESSAGRGAASGIPPRWISGWRAAAIIVLAVVAAYANSLGGDFVFDDRGQIVENERVWSLAAWWAGLGESSRPVVDLTLAANFEWGGGGEAVWSFHAVNMVIHGLGALTLFGVVRRMARMVGFGRGARVAAFWTASLWAVHPLNTQAVTYAIQRSESLMGLFYLLTIYCVTRGAESERSRAWSVLAVIACALGMGSKAVMATAPVVAALLDGLMLSGSVRGALRRRWGLYLGLCGTWGVLAICGVATKVLVGGDSEWRSVGFGVEDVSAWQYALSQPAVILHYLRLAVWPTGLCLDYGPWSPDEHGVHLGALAVLTTLIGLTVWSYRRRHWTAACGVWFFLILAPTSSFVPIRDPMFEHRMYLPLAAVVAIIVGFAGLLVKRIIERQSSERFRLATDRLVTGAATIAMITLAALTIARNQTYQSRLRMWEDVVTKRSQNPRGWQNLGVALMAEQRYADAAHALRQAIRIHPKFADAHMNLGLALLKDGKRLEATESLRRAVAIRPEFADAHYNLGKSLVDTGRCDLAVASFKEALRLRDSHAASTYNLGKCQAVLGQIDDAISTLRRAVKADPSHAPAWSELGRLLSGTGADIEAIRCYETAITIDPNLPEPRYNLANALVRAGRTEDGIVAYRDLLALDDGHIRARGNLGAALLTLGDVTSAERILRETIRRDSTYVPAHYNLGRALLAREDVAGARRAFENALTAAPDHEPSRNALATLDER
jgi:tetratricopeptide (TPR) repeat protein